MIFVKIALWFYIIGFILVLFFHRMFLPMVTLPLALLRAALWPLFVATGIPHGMPLPMD